MATPHARTQRHDNAFYMAQPQASPQTGGVTARPHPRPREWLANKQNLGTQKQTDPGDAVIITS